MVKKQVMLSGLLVAGLMNVQVSAVSDWVTPAGYVATGVAVAALYRNLCPVAQREAAVKRNATPKRDVDVNSLAASPTMVPSEAQSPMSQPESKPRARFSAPTVRQAAVGATAGLAMYAAVHGVSRNLNPFGK